MSHPRPSVPAHATHDELLVARLAGGDTLDPGEHANASALVASCPDCALLASDIVAISRAVATETVPQRRRDFRISPEQAAKLRGSPLQRLLRRFTVPSGGGALRPLASGALSIGLVLVFVGSVIPRPAPEPAAAPAARDEVDGLRASDDLTEATPSVKVGVTEESDAMGGEPPADEQGLEGLGEAAGTMALEIAAAGEPGGTPGPASAPEVAADAAPEGAAQSLERLRTIPSPARFAAPSPAIAAPSPAIAAPSPDMLAMREGEADVAPDERMDAVADEATEPTLDDGAALAVDDDDPDIGLVLIVIGGALVAVGAVLGLLLIASRRRPDPLGD